MGAVHHFAASASREMLTLHEMCFSTMPPARVLLIYPPSWKRIEPTPPLGIATLAAALRRDGCEVVQLDLELEELSRRHLGAGGPPFDARSLSDHARMHPYLEGASDDDYLDAQAGQLLSCIDVDFPDVVALSMMGHNQLAPILLIALYFKAARPEVPVVLGGQFVQYNAENLLGAYPPIDCCIRGDAWASLPPLVRLLARGLMPGPQDEADIPGLVYRRSGRIVSVPPTSPPIKTMPTPEFEPGSLPRYAQLQGYLYGAHYEQPLLQYVLGTGCPRACVFCQRPSDAKLRFKPPEQVAAELAELAGTYGADQFDLVCNEINPGKVGHKYATDLVEAIGRLAPARVRWYAYAIPQNLGRKECDDLYRAGCRLLKFGIETGSERVLEHMNKEFTVAEASEVLRCSNAAGLWNHINLMVGYVHETAEDIEQTKRFVREHRDCIDSVRINPFFLTPKTPLFEHADEYDIKIVATLGDYVVFDERSGASWEEKARRTVETANDLGDYVKSLGIGFHGAMPELVFVSLCKYGDKSAVKAWLRQHHPYLYENYTYAEAKWRCHHPDEAQPFPEGWAVLAGTRSNQEHEMVLPPLRACRLRFPGVAARPATRTSGALARVASDNGTLA
jgi:radical SAM superfamily enzyme YgiQ (UPF0313 family)